MTDTGQFTLFSRILHWTMAAMILTMLFIGVGMVPSGTVRRSTQSRPIGNGERAKRAR
jgi:cytochrome b561